MIPSPDDQLNDFQLARVAERYAAARRDPHNEPPSAGFGEGGQCLDTGSGIPALNIRFERLRYSASRGEDPLGLAARHSEDAQTRPIHRRRSAALDAPSSRGRRRLSPISRF